MRLLGTLFTMSIVAFWVVMNALLVEREVALRNQDHYHRGVNAFLGNSLGREHWMSIYRRHKKVGYSGYMLEKVPALEGVEYNLNVETLWRGALPLPEFLSRLAGDRNQLHVQGQLVLGADLKPRQLHVDISLTLLRGSSFARTHRFFVTGERAGDKLRAQLSFGENRLFEVNLPVDDLTLSDGLTPALPVAGYKVGDSYRLHVFDPLDPFGLGSETVLVRVTDQKTQEINGLPLDIYVLETEFRGTKSSSTVTASGEVLEQTLGPPLGLVLRRENSRKQARMGFTGGER